MLAVPADAPIQKPTTVLLAVGATSQPSIPAHSIVRWLREQLDAQVTRVHVGLNGDASMPMNAGNGVEPQQNGSALERIPQLKGRGIVPTINAYIRSHTTDLLVMERHKKTLLEQLFQVSNTREMMMHTHVPLLVLPPPRTNLQQHGYTGS